MSEEDQAHVTATLRGKKSKSNEASKTRKFPLLKLKSIEVLTDFSPNAESALRIAAALAETYGAKITLAHAYMPPPSAFAAPQISMTLGALEHWQESLSELLKHETKSLLLRGIKCSELLREGAPKELLDNLTGVDLIAIGTEGLGGLKKAAMGSTAEEIFRTSRIPVLTVGPHCKAESNRPFRIDSVLFATDFSEEAAAALPYAVSLAKENDAQLILLNVQHENAPFSFDRAMASAEPLEQLHHLVPDSVSLKHRPAYVVGFGSASSVILQEALNRKADLIVMGAHGAGAMSGAISHFGGGTAYRVAAHAACPVITVRKR